MPELFKNVARLLQGSALAQLIAFAALPLLSRLYEPEMFGAVQAMMSLLSIALIFSALRLELAILSTPEERIAGLLHGAAWLCVATCSATLAVVVACHAGFWNAGRAFDTLLYALPVLTLLAGWNQLIAYLALRRKAFATSADSKVVQSAAYIGSSLAFGLVHPASWTLATADGLGRVASLAFTLRRLGLSIREFLRPPTIAALTGLLRSHRELATVGLGAALINALGSSLNTILLLWIFSAHDAGQYAIVERVIGMPIALIVGAASQVFMAHLSDAMSAPPANAHPGVILRAMVVAHAKVGVIPAVLLFAFAPAVIPFALGPEWQPAGEFARVLAPLYFVAFVVGPVNMALTVLGRQHLQFAWDSGRLAVMLLVWGIAWACKLSALHAILLYAVAAGLCYLVYLALADRALAGHPQGQS